MEGGAKVEKQDEKKLLNTLKSIDGTLKRIEQLHCQPIALRLTIGPW